MQMRPFHVRFCSMWSTVGKSFQKKLICVEPVIKNLFVGNILLSLHLVSGLKSLIKLKKQKNKDENLSNHR